jgi:hypothetical protein
MKTPKWAEDILLSALIHEEIEDIPTLKCRKRQAKTSSGCYYPERLEISLAVGQDRMDAKLVLLHEVSHHVTFIKSKCYCHTDRFWITAWNLYRHFGLPIRYCKHREGNYKKGSLVSYKQGLKLNK